MKRNVLLVDDHPMAQEGYAARINREPDLQVCCVARSADEALAMASTVSPDVVVADLSADGVGEIDLTRRLLAFRPDLPMLVVSAQEEPRCGERALRAGARGYLLKRESDAVVPAIRKVLAGRLYMSDEMSRKILTKLLGGSPRATASPIDRLTDREVEVFELMGRGLSTREAAAKLRISPKTVEAHRGHIRAKLGVSTTERLILMAHDWVQHLKTC